MVRIASMLTARSSRSGWRGYRFITVERAPEDSAFHSADTFVGAGGITWLHRRALIRKMPKTFYAGEPETPALVVEAAKP